ncbi:MAG: hypothetical protein GY811_04635 [Myxococcales bacterium]|nr:hypothetical protein [Myxococcales bacterium]
MSQHTVLAISPNLDQLRRIVDGLQRTGATVDAIRSTDAITSERIGHRYVFVDIGEVSETERLRDLEVILERTSEHTHIAIITDNAPLQEFTRLLQDVRVNHIISREEIEQGVFVTAQKLLSGDIFGIERYVPEGTPVHYCRLNDFQGRGEAIDTVLDFAKESKIRGRLREGIGKVCEELLMNALYDAPVDESGVQIFAEVEPHDRVATCSPRPVSIRYAATETQFAIAVRDRYGRLAKNTIIAYINKCQTSGNQIDRKTYGAGLGLYIVANAVASYVVNVAYDIATEVICTFDRKSRTPLRLVGVFIHPGGAEMLKQGPTPGAGPK